MAWTAADLAALESAIARGEQTVQFSDRQVTYRSIDALLKARAAVIAELGSGGAKQTVVVNPRG